MTRDEFTKVIENVFDNLDNFLDIVLYDLPIGYDLATADDEIYLVDREGHTYLNWYKPTHVGRDLHTNMTDKQIIDFLEKLKAAKDKEIEDNRV